MQRYTHTLLVAAALMIAIPVLQPSEADAQYRYRRARPAAAVVVYPRGLYVGGGLLGTLVVDQSGGPEYLESGVGGSLFGGIRFGQVLALELGWLGSLHNPQTVDVGFGPETDFLILAGGTLDAKIFLNTQSQAGEPFIQGGFGLYTLGSDNFGTDSIGTGFQLGGGYNFWVGENLDLGVRALYRGIAMGPPQSNIDDTFISAVTLEGNLTIHFN